MLCKFSPASQISFKSWSKVLLRLKTLFLTFDLTAHKFFFYPSVSQSLMPCWHLLGSLFLRPSLNSSLQESLLPSHSSSGRSGSKLHSGASQLSWHMMLIEKNPRFQLWMPGTLSSFPKDYLSSILACEEEGPEMELSNYGWVWSSHSTRAHTHTHTHTHTYLSNLRPFCWYVTWLWWHRPLDGVLLSLRSCLEEQWQPSCMCGGHQL